MSPAAKARAWWQCESPFTRLLVTILSASLIGLGTWIVSTERTNTEHSIRLEAVPNIVSRLDAFESKFDRTTERFSELLDNIGQRLARIEGAQQKGR